MIGKIIDKAELQARWAYSEMISSRFSVHYKPQENKDLFDKAEGGVDFTLLDSQERSRLVILHEHYRRDFLKLINVPVFRCESRSRSEFEHVKAIDFFNNGNIVPFTSFLTSPRGTRDSGEPHPKDPRVQADMISDSEPLQQKEPVILGLISPDNYVLVDGYLRAVLFMRSKDPNASILIWVPSFDR